MQFEHEQPPEIGMIMQSISMHNEHTRRNAVNREEADSPAARKLSPE